MSDFANKFSFKHGEPQSVGDTLYAGKVPEYRNLGDSLVPHWVRVTKGIPFVRVTRRRHDEKNYWRDHG